ncbi:hypothetical protein AB1A81_09560 [Bdellovibrio bacteriovorus]|uniref:Uncharacterized protein n=1 Tax=Bdellovibrio bacteriovorus (strain ATCC 15356 / DSM 50701 / NCIMB 9529 / HD100) TaxID=264462 RepID=Q6MLC5_BDEBA|nr:hypothetical protein [Bdellovibrio bacteriovorus]AHZ84578.1 hypothetical protein EP01_06460 [Bdellovibrio bacteriovorus]BEV68467.1 hypothetical protein Bb109J_c1887 [Bdellovibrio bacteriovorus]CAE79932.1 hypothetical protein predicted by Glimmer/Critica [Bdellovibrio bacteriovorus HD100]
MIPRLKSSKKWTSFPKEYSDQIQAVFKENFAQYLDNAQLIIEGRIYQEEIVLRVGYLEEGRLAQANFEVSMSYSQEQQDAVSRIHNCVDAAASMMLEFLENEGEVDFPYTWKEVPFQGKKVYLKFSTENSNLEAEANKLLGLSEDDMLHDTDEEADEDALSRAEQSEELSPPRDDEDYSEDEVSDESEEDSEDKGPKMFGGKGKKQLH